MTHGRLLPMGLNIKNERVHQLAKRAARTLGTSQTRAIEIALERLLAESGDDAVQVERLRREREVAALVTELHEEARRTRPGPIMRPEDLYDATGLPA